MVYKYTKTTEYTKFNLKTKEINFNLQKGASILMVYGYTSIQSIQNLSLENIKHQFYLTKRGFHIDGIQLYEDYRVYKI